MRNKSLENSQNKIFQEMSEDDDVVLIYPFFMFQKQKQRRHKALKYSEKCWRGKSTVNGKRGNT